MKIEKMIEQHKQMWAAFEKLNEKLEEKQAPYEPKDGEYVHQDKYSINDYKGILENICIYNSDNDNCYAMYVLQTNSVYLGVENYVIDHIRPATPEEKQLLDNKLKEQGKRWNAEKKCIEDIPTWKVGDWFIPHKPKEPTEQPFWTNYMDIFDGKLLKVESIISQGYLRSNDFDFRPDWCEKTEEPKKEPKIGEHHIFFNSNNELAIIATLDFIDDTRNVKSRYKASDNRYYDNCIPFESIEQYKKFINEKR